ncbi:MAG: 4-(cytidine 5'-diphospho)-2-C-methyl-D-erythritol kinase [Paludibacteraceae bacterium]|nr:4-(cytidine 5'-diphospho)-2-C-methyl-D-erythritol kinase [Paludibacteraceae bacterium]
MICFPNAKINLGLNIVSRLPNGYHNIETVFYPIPLCDVLEFVPAQKTSLYVEGVDFEGDIENNLVVRVLRLLQKDFLLPELEIFLQKKIPVGAGLGGGSSDAAFMLKMLNQFFGLELSIEQMENYVSQLGADCAFFIKNKPVFATGIGNVFSDIDVSLKDLYLALIKPNIFVSTKEAYSNVVPKRPLIPLVDSIGQPVSFWKNTVENDFEKGIFELYPQIAKLKKDLYQNGAIYASMSGSGSSVYGIFQEKPILKISDCELEFCEKFLE